MGLAGPLLAGLVLLALGGSCRAAVVSVSTSNGFMDALFIAAAPRTAGQEAIDTVIQVQADIALTRASTAVYQIPVVMSANQTVTVRGVERDNGTLVNLDLGGVHALLLFQGTGSLIISRLNISGMEDPVLGSWPDEVDSPTVSQTMPFWPTVIAYPGYTSGIENSIITLPPTALCTPEVGAAQFAGLQQLALSSGSNASDVYTNATSAYFADFAAPVPVLSAVTKVSIGTVSVYIRNTTVHCSQAAANSSAGSGSSSESSSGTPGWVWAIVGVAAAVAATLLLAGVLWRQRRRRRRQQQDLLTVKVVDSAELPSGPSSSTPKQGSDELVSGPLTSAGNSGMLDGLSGSIPEGPWKTRVGFIEGLQLGGLLGRGGYARVYKGRWKGTTVAVKVVEANLSHDQRLDLQSEPVLSLSLSHPNVLQGYKMCAVKVLTDGEIERVTQEQCAAELTSSSPGYSEGSGGIIVSNSGGRIVPHLTNPNCMVQVMPADAVLEPGMYEMWLVQELADKGTLSDAMKAGWLSQAAPPGRNMPVILLCLLDVARGLEYLHSCSIVHGDLKPQNVLLKTSGSDRRGYVCKLGDFGLSRMLGEAQTHVDTGSYGTVTHAAPELLSEGRLTKASDVFAFGMLLWELVTGERLFADMHHMQIIVQVTQHGYRPPLPADFPPQLANLVQRCWSTDASLRPDAEAVVQELIAFGVMLSSTAASAAAATTADAASLTAENPHRSGSPAAIGSTHSASGGLPVASPFAAAAVRADPDAASLV